MLCQNRDESDVLCFADMHSWTCENYNMIISFISAGPIPKRIKIRMTPSFTKFEAAVFVIMESYELELFQCSTLAVQYSQIYIRKCY